MQLAQREDPVPEGDLNDKRVDQGAADSSNEKTFDKGHIAPEPGMKTKPTDGEEQNEVEAEYALMQPVYSREYTESVEPRHIPADNVSFVSCDWLRNHCNNQPCQKGPHEMYDGKLL